MELRLCIYGASQNKCKEDKEKVKSLIYQIFHMHAFLTHIPHWGYFVSGCSINFPVLLAIIDI